MYRNFFEAFFFLIALSVHGQQGVQRSEFTLRNYTAIDGLPQSQVSAVVEDDNGYLWMATLGGGLARFDGREFKVYTTLNGLLSNIISYLTIDSQKNLWIVHPRGITRFDGVSFKKFQASGELSKSKMVRRAFVFQDTLFIISAPGVLGKIYKDSVYYWSREYETGKNIMRVQQTANGNLCIFMSDGRIILKSPAGAVPVGLLPEGSDLFSTYNYGDDVRVILYNDKDQSFATYGINQSYKELKKIQSEIKQHVLLFDHISKMYWLQGDQGLLTLREGESTPDVILEDINVNQVCADKEGNFWIATNGGGLYKYFHQDFSKCSSENMRGVMSILKDHDRASWIGTMNKGLWKIKNGKVNNYIDTIDSYRNSINCIAESPEGTVWIGTAGGLGKYDQVNDEFIWFTPKDGLSGYSVFNICFDENENLWIGTPTGLNYFDGKTFKQYKTEQGLLTNRINSTYYAKKLKTLFIGNEFGVNTVSHGKVKRLEIKGFENTTINSIQPYQDSLILLGSGGAGFAIYNPKTTRSKFINTRDGLISDFIYFIAADDQHKLWVGSEKGISKLILNSEFEIVENLHFDHDNGLEGVETNQNAFYFSKEKKLFGLIDGLYEFNDLKRAGHHAKLHLTNVDLFYGEESARNYADSLIGFFKLPYKPVLPFDKNHITFSFNRVDKRYPKSVRFKYSLKNYDKSWSIPSVNRQVTYSNLPPGNYEFQLMATNSLGSWSEVQLRYPFIIKAPFYQTATFITISILMVLGVIIFVAYLRVRQRVEKAMMLERIRVREQESLRKEIARDFHDEMGNQLTRIINYVSLLKLNGIDGINGSNGSVASSHSELYMKVENSAKYLYYGTRDFIWAIDPVNDEMSKLFIHIRDFGEKLFEEKDIKFRALNGVKEKIRLPYGFSREVNLIFKEAMTNTFKYSKSRNATLSLQRERDGFEFYFEDDGIGFNASDIEKLSGLKNIRERADKIQAVLRIRSREGSGTKISLSFQLTKNTEIWHYHLRKE